MCAHPLAKSADISAESGRAEFAIAYILHLAV